MWMAHYFVTCVAFQIIYCTRFFCQRQHITFIADKDTDTRQKDTVLSFWRVVLQINCPE